MTDLPQHLLYIGPAAAEQRPCTLLGCNHCHQLNFFSIVSAVSAAAAGAHQLSSLVSSSSSLAVYIGYTVIRTVCTKDGLRVLPKDTPPRFSLITSTSSRSHG
ncbi:hypothetical protein Q8A67_000844 [Cirrhinus molitorella]|uniref:Uncharacterized protein n=1 Tax=Cirrhinus molitorella TaxID=172907 RepID=A0AA88QGM3_9TELE|nr:hypothetical protein Q8A67_000844 [Cirrhinus molitorella]